MDIEKVKVSDLAGEFNVKNAAVVTELKKIGVMVISPDTPVDSGIANRIRKRLQFLAEQEQEEIAKAERAREKAKAKVAEAKAKKEAEAPKKPLKGIKKLKEHAEAAPARVEAAPPAPAPAAPAAVEPVKERPTATAKAQPATGKKTATAAAPTKAPASRKTPGSRPEAAPARVEKPVVVSMAPRKGRKVIREVEEPLDTPAPAAGAPAGADTATRQAASGQEPELHEAPDVEASPVPEKVDEAAARLRVVPKPETPARPAEGQTPARLARPVVTVLKSTSIQPAAPLQDLGRRFARPSAPPPRPMHPHRPGGRPFHRPGPRRPQAPAQHRRQISPVPVEPAPAPRPHFTELRDVTVAEGISVKDLSEKLEVKSKDMLKELLNHGMMASINQTLDEAMTKEICEAFGFRANVVSFEKELEQIEERADLEADFASRAPVVTVMGHVDHGKTSLLDAIRETRVTEGEAGGITQHIGAYKVQINKRDIIFLDTPGHEAFTLMRARGAQVTDIVVLVVAADDGVMPQTVEAIHHARAAGVPILVAINKIDKPGAGPDKVKQELSEHNLLAEDWGGDVVMVSVSAKQKTNLDLLLEMVLLVADIKDAKANPKRRGTGTILEAKLDRGRGAVATLLIQNGSVHVGDSFIAGAVYGKVRAMLDDRGRQLSESGPSSVVEILGLQGMPQAGDNFAVIEDSLKAKQIGAYRQAQIRDRDMLKSSRLSLDQLQEQLRSGAMKELPLILKADVQGSVEVLEETLKKLGTEKVKIKIIHSGVGAITETDVLLASASGAIIVGFSVRPEKKAEELAEREGVDIRLHTIIYNVSSEIKNAMLGLLEFTYKEKSLGRAEVRNTFRLPKAGMVAGCYVTDGSIARNSEVRLLRDNVVTYEGRVQSLRRFKEDVSEVKNGYECGIVLERFNDLKNGDIIEAFTKEKVAPKWE